MSPGLDAWLSFVISKKYTSRFSAIWKLLPNWVSFIVNILRLNQVYPLFIDNRNIFTESTRCRHCTGHYGGRKHWKALWTQSRLIFLVPSPTRPFKPRSQPLCSCNPQKTMFSCSPPVDVNALLSHLSCVGCHVLGHSYNPRVEISPSPTGWRERIKTIDDTKVFPVEVTGVKCFTLITGFTTSEKKYLINEWLSFI